MPCGGTGSSIGGSPDGNRGAGPGNESANTSLIRYLEKHQGTAKFMVATSNAASAESIILATGKPVMALGGFTGSDPILTVSKLEALVKQGVVRYFLFGREGGLGGGGTTASLTSWVQQHAKVITVGGTQLYELTR